MVIRIMARWPAIITNHTRDLQCIREICVTGYREIHIKETEKYVQYLVTHETSIALLFVFCVFELYITQSKKYKPILFKYKSEGKEERNISAQRDKTGTSITCGAPFEKPFA